jgi:hypothetical protein
MEYLGADAQGDCHALVLNERVGASIVSEDTLGVGEESMRRTGTLGRRRSMRVDLGRRSDALGGR